MTVYYTSDLSLNLKDIAQFESKVFTGMVGLAHHLFQVALLIIGRNHNDQPVLTAFCHTAPL